MKKVGRRACMLFLFTLFAFIVVGAAAASPGAPGALKSQGALSYSAALAGFSSPLFSSAEYLDFSLAWELRKGRFLNPALSARFLLPANPFSPADSLAGLGLDLTLLYAQNHPLAWMSPRRTALAPQLGLCAYFPLADPQAFRFAAELSLFRLYAGYGYFSFGDVSLIFDTAPSLQGWGFRILKFSYLVFAGETR